MQPCNSVIFKSSHDELEGLDIIRVIKGILVQVKLHHSIGHLSIEVESTIYKMAKTAPMPPIISIISSNIKYPRNICTQHIVDAARSFGYLYPFVQWRVFKHAFF